MTQFTWYVIYKTTHVETDQFYVGRHQTTNLDDGYQGSGNWVRSFDDTSVLQTEIVEYCEDAEHLKEREQHYIDLWFDDELCMNVSRASEGGAPETLPTAWRNALRESWTPERRLLKSQSLTGKKLEESTIAKISRAWTPERREQKRHEVSTRNRSEKQRLAARKSKNNNFFYTITFLNSGQKVVTNNLSHWAKSNGFKHAGLFDVAAGRQKTTQGLTCRKVTKEEYDALLAA